MNVVLGGEGEIFGREVAPLVAVVGDFPALRADAPGGFELV